MNKINVLNIKKTKRSNLCLLCKGNSGIITKYKLFVCRHCMREHYHMLGWQKQK